MSLERRTTHTPASDGEHDCDLYYWWLTGPRGAAGFAAYCYPAGSAMAALAAAVPASVYRVDDDGDAWLGAVVACHARRPMFDGHDSHAPCDVLGPGRPCYSDGSGLHAHTLLCEWATAGWDEEVIWATLTHVYEARFQPGAEALRDALEEMAADPGALDQAIKALASPAEAAPYLLGDPAGMADPGFMEEVRPGYTDRQRP